MGERDAKYRFAGIVELDDAHQYLKMQAIPDVKRVTLIDFAQHYIEAGSIINRDKYRSLPSMDISISIKLNL